MNNNENRTMRLLTAFGIILIVAGHFSADYLSLGGLFPYYAFHVYIFLFVSGYFYKAEDEKNIPSFLLRKAKRLLLPYFIFNLLYGILSAILVKAGVILVGELNLKNLFIEPFLSGHQFMFNFPAWFVPALFVTETINVLMRKILGLVFKKQCQVDWICFIGCLAVGIATVYFSITGHVWGYWKMPGRWLIMMFGIEFGRVFKEYIEPGLNKLLNRFGKLPSALVYFGLVGGIEYVLMLTQNGLNFSVVWCTAFANGPVIPFVTVTTGVLWYYGISRVLCELVPPKSRLLNPLLEVGRRSYSIMTNHIFVLFLINTVCMLLARNNIGCAGFDFVSYASDSVYQYLYAGYHATHIINTVVCVSVPTIIAKCVVK